VDVPIGNVNVNFAGVTTAGLTTVVATTPGPTDPPPPAGFALGDPPVYYAIETDAVVTPPITVCIDYTGTNFDNEALIQLRHFEPPNWVDVTVSRDPVNDVICGEADSLSLWAIFDDQTQQCVRDPRRRHNCLVCIGKGKRQTTISIRKELLNLFLRLGADNGKCPTPPKPPKPPKHDDDDDGRRH
jgi:hypothetical protein